MTLTANESANYVYLGFGFDPGTGYTSGHGTLVLNGNTLTAYSINIGTQTGDSGVIDESKGGSFSTNYLTVGGGTTTAGTGNTFTFSTSDVTQNLNVSFGSLVKLSSASTNLGVGGSISVYGGGTLDLQGQNINTFMLNLGTNGGGPNGAGTWNLANRGTITTGSLSVFNGTLTLVNDTTQSLVVGSGGQVTTTVAGNIATPSSGGNEVSVYGGMLNLKADLSLASAGNAASILMVDSGGTVNANGHNISATDFYLGVGAVNNGSFTLSNTGTITVTELEVANGTLKLGLNDTVGHVVNIFAGGQVITSATGNIAAAGSEIVVYSGGTLTLGANLNLHAARSQRPQQQHRNQQRRHARHATKQHLRLHRQF